MAEGGEERYGEMAAPDRPLPLNSKRLLAAHVRQLARTLELPTTASANEIRQMIDGKLTEMGREPPNVQVVVQRELGGTLRARLYLQDESGVFMESEPAPEPHSHGNAEESDEELSDQGEEPEEVGALKRALKRATEENAMLAAEVSELKGGLQKQKDRVKELWKLNCEQLAEHDSMITAKDEEIASLRARLEGLVVEGHSPGGRSPSTRGRPLVPLDHPPSHEGSIAMDHGSPATGHRPPLTRRGKAPPVDSFTGENPEVRIDDWLPALERASTWNGWSEEERLMQLAGHLRGRALQEWNLLGEGDKETYAEATQALRSRLDPGGRALAAQDFRHTVQGETEGVADFIRRLERTFRIAYGRDNMSSETRDTLLHSQLQEGLRYDLMKGPAVSGAQAYKELCLAAKNEEKRLAGLKKRQHYQKPMLSSMQHPRKPVDRNGGDRTTQRRMPPRQQMSTPSETRQCYVCNKPGHLARDCKMSKTESKGRPAPNRLRPASTKQVQAKGDAAVSQERVNPMEFLYSSDSEEESKVRIVRVTDGGSISQCARLQVQGVPVFGIIDSGADITIMGGELFKKVAAAARLKKRDFKKPDKVPRTYDQQPFTLDGRMDLDVTFGERTMRTPVYLKMDAHDQLLLSEGVCRQLGIISYHPDVQAWRGGRKQPPAEQKDAAKDKEAKVPTVRVKLLQSVQLLPHQAVVAQVQLDSSHCRTEPLLLERSAQTEEDTGLQIEDALLQPSTNGRAQLVLSNPLGFTQSANQGLELGTAIPATVVHPDLCDPTVQQCDQATPLSKSHEPEAKINRVTVEERRAMLMERVEEPDLPDKEKRMLLGFLADHHEAFCLEENERGETDLVQFEIETNDAAPKKLPVRRMPFTVRQEVARQLKRMQETDVIQPSNSPWASPVVLVRKKDGTHRFCVDYRELNSVTRADTFPLPRIDDLLDQLGESVYFSTLDLATGYWQIRVHPDSQEKTAFVTPQGLYEFKVMPFGLTNAPAVFQRLMQRVLMGLNPEEGPDFVAVYIDDILIFSRTLEEHIEHLRLVFDRLVEAGLKLKPAKCHFIRKEVEYLGHIITPQGLKTNPKLVTAVQGFPVPRNVQEVRRFLGMSSYYRRFIPRFSKVAQPLHALTRKGAEFLWNDDCHSAFESLKQRLISSPVLAYPAFTKPFTLETDASIQGLGAVLSQKQEDGKSHPVAYASRALSAPERNYSITELETLAVVWAISHFHTYLYGNCVTVYTDHSAVKAVLQTPNPTGKHARWWTKVYGSGVKEVNIIYRSGKTNLSADALSRSPQAPPPAGSDDNEIQVAAVTSHSDKETSIQSLLQLEPGRESNHPNESVSFASEQRKDPHVKEIIQFLEKGELPHDPTRARKIAVQGPLFTLVDDVLFYLDPKHNDRRRAVVPEHIRGRVMEENHRGAMGGHFSGNRLYNTLARHWWWEGMYSDALHYSRNCPECAIVSGGGRQHRPPLHPIPVQRPFQIIGVHRYQFKANALNPNIL